MILNNYINRYTSFRNLWLALVVLILGLLLTALATFYSLKEAESDKDKEFQLTCNKIKAVIIARLHSHAQLLRCSASLFQASDSVTRNEWRLFNKFSNISQNLPGIQGLGYSLIVPKNKLKQHIQSIRKEGFLDYNIKPAGDREIYTSIIYLEPFVGRNLRAFGYDMFTERVRREAMELARDSNLAILSGKVILVQETSKDIQFGTLMYIPVYRNGMSINNVEERRSAITGWVYSPYRMNDLMRNIISGTGLINKSRIYLRIYDNDSLSSKTLLYKSENTVCNNDSVSLSHEYLTTIEFNGKKWLLSFSQPKTQLLYFGNELLAVFISGVIISILIFILILILLNISYRAKLIKEKLTKDILESEEKYKYIFNSVADAIIIYDISGNILAANQSASDEYGYSKDEFITLKIHQIDSSKQGMYIKERIKIIMNVGSLSFETIHQRKDKTEFYVDLNSKTIIFNDQEAIISICRNVDKRKFEEEMLKTWNTKFKKLTENLPGMVFQLNMNYDGTFSIPIASKGIVEIFGCLPEDVREDNSQIVKSIYPDDLSRVINEIEYSANHLTLLSCEFRVQIPGKETRWIISQSTPEKLADGRITWYGFITDITERKKVEIELQLSNVILKTQQNASIDGILVMDEEGGILSFNERFVQMWGIPSDVIESKSNELIVQAIMDKYTDVNDFNIEVKYLQANRKKIINNQI